MGDYSYNLQLLIFTNKEGVYIYIQKPTDFAMFVAVYLSRNKENGFIGIHKISSETKIPFFCTVKALNMLNKAKLVKTKGFIVKKYSLVQLADSTSLYDILESIAKSNPKYFFKYSADKECLKSLSQFYELMNNQKAKILKSVTLIQVSTEFDSKALFKKTNDGKASETKSIDTQKSIDQSNRKDETCLDFEESFSAKGSSKKKSLWKDVAFYAVLVALVIGVLIFKSNGNGAPTSFAGYSAFTVLSESMQSEIPKGSLVITKQIEPQGLNIGDDITYMNGPDTTVTHRIIGIIEQYQDTGQRAFITKGIMNDDPDKAPVPAVNIVGKVVFHDYTLGQILEFIQQYWYFIILFLVLFSGFFVAIRKLFEKSDNPKAGHFKET